MATNGKQTSKNVLHVRSIRAFACHENTAGEQIDSKLHHANYQVEVCTDVYRALARLCKADHIDHDTVSSYQAAVVCVDILSQAEFEFFTIIAKHARKTPALVYSNSDSTNQLTAAQAAGATGIFDEDFIAKLSVDPIASPISQTPQTLDPVSQVLTQAPLQTQTSPQTPQPQLEPKVLQEEIVQEEPVSPALTLHQEALEETDEDTLLSDEAEEPLAGPVQVPWQSRQASPVRMPPSQSENIEASLSTDLPEHPKEDANDPLITKDELAALLDEDVASWPPADWSDPDAASPNSGAEL